MEKRKPNRLKSYDYSQNGAYFLTICTKDMKCILWNAQSHLSESLDEALPLSSAGLAADAVIREIPLHYSGVFVEKHVVMPNHLHMILLMAGNSLSPVVDISRIVKQLKSVVTKMTGCAVWQKSFHDHVIRDEKEHRVIWDYIDANPLRWKDDCYYAGEQI